LKKVLILFGGNSSEHIVSCKSAKSVFEAVDRELFACELAGIDFYNRWFKFEGELSFLDSFGIKYVGCGCLEGAICMDKAMSKTMFDVLDIPVIPYAVLNEGQGKDELRNLRFPLIVKPCNGGSSIGISKANNEVELDNAVEEARKYDEKIIVEEFISCRELECAVLEKDGKLIVSNPGEIKSSNELYDYDAKYVDIRSYTVMPDDLPTKTVKMLKEYAKELFLSLNLKSLARIDFGFAISNLGSFAAACHRDWAAVCIPGAVTPAA